METYFEIDGFSERENLVAQLIACLAMDETDSELFKQTIEALRLDNSARGLLQQGLEKVERALAASDGNLSDLLAKASKSTCCS